MEISIDGKTRLAKVWCSHADQQDKEKQEKLRAFITDCKKKNIFVCVFESGGGDLLENTKELLAYNLNSQTSRVKTARLRNAR